MGMSLEPWKFALDPDLQKRTDAMAEELCRQSANISAAEYRWLRLLGEFDDIGGWATGGARSCAAWLSWACGVSPPAARERVRVARALPTLPRVCASFAAGRLSYSKVRAITRVASPENEELLVEYGESATAAQLEKVLRGYRRVRRLEDARAAAEMADRRSVKWWVDEEGFVRISARLTPGDGAVVVAQLERLAESGGEDTPAPIAEPAGNVSAEALETSRGDVPAVLPGWAAPDPVDVRRADALKIIAETAAAHGPTSAVGGDTHLVVLHIAEPELRADEPADSGSEPDPATAVNTEIEGIGRVSAETVRRIACDAEITVLVEDALGRPLGVGRQSDKVPRWIRRALKRRDDGRCQFPSCLATRFLDAHHIKHWADGGPTDLDNLVLLCRFHHRLVHEVGYRIRRTGEQLTFVRPNGGVVPARREKVEGLAETVAAENDRLELGIDELTGIPKWDGKPPDYSLAVEVLYDVSAEAVVSA